MKLPVLLRKGAEANLYLADWHDRKVVLKERLPKKYRPKQLDKQIRVYRTTHEPQLMHEAKKAGVPTPTIFLVDVRNTTIIMEYVEGKQVKQVFETLSENGRQRLCFRIGELIGKLHIFGIIHGDLTTSNMILDPEQRIFFVDFGLGERADDLEARGVDLHLMKRVLQTTHFQHAEKCFDQAAKGYAHVLGGEASGNVLEKIRDIERRGRYVAERRQDS